jgi:hypothetical protein
MIMNFEEKVKSMTAKGIILTMIDALENPVVRIDMNSFGYEYNGICFGCAATNTVCKISGVTFTPDDINLYDGQWKVVNTDHSFLQGFEHAIDSLRQGDIQFYNNNARKIGIAEIEDYGIELPCIDNYNYNNSEVLNAYRKLADAQTN